MIMRSKTSKSFILQLVRIRRRVDQAAALPPSYSLVTRWEQHCFLVPCYVLLFCPLLCVTFLSLVMCYFLVPCYVLLPCPLLFVTCCTSHSDGTYLGHQVGTCHSLFTFHLLFAVLLSQSIRSHLGHQGDPCHL